MKVRIGLALVAAMSGLLATIGAAPAAAAPAAGSGGALVAKPGVTTIVARISVSDMTVQATPPQSFCYVGVSWPVLSSDRRVTATWALDCRSLANPAMPAPDIAGASLQVRIFQGVPSVWDPPGGTMLKGLECLSIQRTNPSCAVTTDSPVQFGIPYYTRLDVKVTLTGGTEPVGAFVTDPIRFI